MQVPQLRRTAVSLLAGSLATGLMLLAPASPVAATAPAAAEAGEPLNIVLLGDSYSAGNGATNDAGQPETYGPENCYRSRVNWTEKYAAALRNEGRTVTVENHACSGGKAPDVISPRVMDTASDSTPTPESVTTIEQADAYLAGEDLCNTQTFPDEEFWTYAATSVDESTIDYDCTRKLKPQADFITPETDLVLFTMGGNDAGFSTIVTQCFILKSGSGCKDTIDTARAKLPEIKQLLLDDIAGIRAAGLRDDAKIVQLGYPYLQADNNYMALGLPPYAAGDEVRSLIDDGTEALAGVATEANVGHPGQMTFVPGIKEAFAGHEPDATTPVGNVDRWVNQTGDGTNTSLWYHPNGLGQTAYAIVLFRGGDYGATPQSPEEPVDEQPETQGPATVRTIFRAQPVKRKVAKGEVVKILTRVRRSDGSRPRGKVVVRLQGKNIRAKARVSASGRNILRFKGLRPGRYRVKAIYTGQKQRSIAFTKVVVRRR
ncbi:hypothetical protein GCM10027020_24140 [Nocardioides salsibiostraticola]